jgi:hypothetical protein
MECNNYDCIYFEDALVDCCYLAVDDDFVDECELRVDFNGT